MLQTRGDVADLVGITSRRLNMILYGTGVDAYYRTWEISKKSGRGIRVISAPRPPLLGLRPTDLCGVEASFLMHDPMLGAGSY